MKIFFMILCAFYVILEEIIKNNSFRTFILHKNVIL